jgi:tetratricopeptide (TPR) repeat protein
VRVLLESILEQGHGALLLLGEAGVGKTRIALEGARLAEERGAVVLAGAADERRGSILRSALDDYDDAVGLPTAHPFASADTLVRTLRAIGGGRTLFLVAEDVHRADESSLHLLHLLVHHAPSIPLALVATCRDDEVVAGSPVSTFVAHLGGERGVRGVRLPRLPFEATRRMVGDVVGTTVPDGLALQIHRTTDGNPFFVAQMARAFREQGRLEIPDGPGDAVRSRVARHGPRIQSALEAAAVLGMRFDFELLHALTAVSGRDLLGTLDACIDARLLSEDGDGYRFRHELVRDALLGSLPPDRARLLHAAAADALQTREEGPGGDGRWFTAIAHHRRESGDAGGAVAPLLAAAEQARARGGDSEAEHHLAAALLCADRDGVQGALRLEVLEALGHARLALGDLAGAGHAFHAAAGLAGSDGWTPVAEVRARAGRLEALSLLAGGRVDEAAVILGTIASSLDFGMERFEATHLLNAIAAHQGAGAPSPPPVDDSPEGSGDEAAGLASPFDVDLCLWEHDLAGRRSPADVLSHARSAREVARERGDLEAEAVARAVEGAALLGGGQADLAEPTLREAAAALAELGHAQGEAYALERLGSLLGSTGRLDEGLAVLRDGLLVAERAPLRWHALTRIQAALGRNRRGAGSTRAAEDAEREASESAAHHGACLTCLGLLTPHEREGT